MEPIYDNIIFSPNDVILKYSPLRKSLGESTYVLGAFNPGLTRLPNGNLLIMVRIAECLENNLNEGKYRIIRFDKEEGFTIDEIPLDQLDMSDPRKYIIRYFKNKTYCLTSFSWLLPIELDKDGKKIINVHYDKAIIPEEKYQEYGIEDARISIVDGKYYMTACSVSSERHSTILYSSDDGLNYEQLGIILDHQNKDMVIFPKKIGSYYYALTRPTGDHYFASNFNDMQYTGPSIYLSKSPDLLHWKPVEDFKISPLKNSLLNLKTGGGAPPIETEEGWLVLFHGVEERDKVGIYRTFACLLDKNNPQIVLKTFYQSPILESSPELTTDPSLSKYIQDVVFTSGISENEYNYILSSGELDLCCRITHFAKSDINNFILGS